MGGVALAGILAALAGYFLYTPNPELPRLSGTVTAGSMVINGHKRTYQAYAPKGLAPGAPLVLAMHGSGENGTAMRIETGYTFERLADERGFAVVYPDGQNGHWNTCEIDRDAKQPGIDDVRFLTALADKFIGETRFTLIPVASFDSAPPQSECQDTNDNKHKETCGQKQLEIVFGVPTGPIGTIAKAVVKQIEIDRTAVPNAVDNTDTQSDAYDNIEQQIHYAREVAGQFPNVGWQHAGRMPDAPLAPGKYQTAK